MSAESLKDKYPLVECDLLALDSPKVSFDISLVQKLKGKTRKVFRGKAEHYK